MRATTRTRAAGQQPVVRAVDAQVRRVWEAHWRAKAAELEQLGAPAVQPTRFVAEMLADLEQRVEAEAPVPLRQGAAETGWSERHLRRLIARGEIQNYGKPHRPLIKLCELPPRARTAQLPPTLSLLKGANA
jgi:hypothetical protein